MGRWVGGTFSDSRTDSEDLPGHEVLRREANNKLHNSKERNFMEWLVLKISKGHFL